MAVCKAIPVPQGCRGRCRDRRDRPQRLRRKRSGRNCQCRHGLTVLQKGKSAQLRTRLAARAPVCNIVEGCCCKLRAGGRTAGLGRAGSAVTAGRKGSGPSFANLDTHCSCSWDRPAQNSAQIARAVGDSSTGVQHRRGLQLQTQGGRTRRRHRTGRRQQLGRAVSGSRVGPDTDQSSSATLARWAKGPAAGCGSC